MFHNYVKTAILSNNITSSNTNLLEKHLKIHYFSPLLSSGFADLTIFG